MTHPHHPTPTHTHTHKESAYPTLCSESCMPWMTVTFMLIVFLLTPCLLLLSELLSLDHHELSSAQTHTLCFSSLAFSSILAEMPGCFRVSSCKCVLKDGSGVISLSSVGDSNGFLLRSRPVPAQGMLVDAEMLLSFRACRPFSQPEEPTEGDCSHVAACLTVR